MTDVQIDVHDFRKIEKSSEPSKAGAMVRRLTAKIQALSRPSPLNSKNNAKPRSHRTRKPKSNVSTSTEEQEITEDKGNTQESNQHQKENTEFESVVELDKATKVLQEKANQWNRSQVRTLAELERLRCLIVSGVPATPRTVDMLTTNRQTMLTKVLLKSFAENEQLKSMLRECDMQYHLHSELHERAKEALSSSGSDPVRDLTEHELKLAKNHLSSIMGTMGDSITPCDDDDDNGERGCTVM